MSGLLFIIIAAIIGFILLCGLAFIIIWTCVRRPGRVLKNQFSTLGDFTGKRYSEIYAVCGVPSSISVTDRGNVKTWRATGYQISLLFDNNDICLGKTN